MKKRKQHWGGLLSKSPINAVKYNRMKWSRNFMEADNVPKRPLPPPTKAQADQRIKFGMITHFMSKIKDSITIGFNNSAGDAIGNAVKYNFKNFIIGEFPNFEINYPKVMISKRKGTCDDLHLELTMSANGYGRLNWEFTSDDCSRKQGRDSIYVLIFDSTRDDILYSNYIGETSTQSAFFELPQVGKSSKLHYWAFISSKDGKCTTESEYLRPVSILDFDYIDKPDTETTD